MVCRAAVSRQLRGQCGGNAETGEHSQFVSALHWVVNRSGRKRYSVQFLVNPSFDAVLAPMAPFVDDSRPA
jgi:isopenicillin N synthase-like dioxygenase